MEKAGDFLKKAFTGSVDGKVTQYLPLFRNWKTIAGADLEQHVRLVDIRNDALVVETAHPGWKQAVLLRKRVMLDRVNGLYPGLQIREIRVQITKKPAARPVSSFPSREDNPQEEDGTASPSEIEELFSRMTDNDLKKALKKLYTSRPRRRTKEINDQNE